MRYASSLVDALLFIHYLAVILLEVRHLQVQFAVKVTRSPDGMSRTYTVGQLSVQRLASWCLDHYYHDFETYNPYLESVARRSSRRMTEFKVCCIHKLYIDIKNNLVEVWHWLVFKWHSVDARFVYNGGHICLLNKSIPFVELNW